MLSGIPFGTSSLLSLIFKFESHCNSLLEVVAKHECHFSDTEMQRGSSFHHHIIGINLSPAHGSSSLSSYSQLNQMQQGLHRNISFFQMRINQNVFQSPFLLLFYQIQFVAQKYVDSDLNLGIQYSSCHHLRGYFCYTAYTELLNSSYGILHIKSKYSIQGIDIFSVIS